MGALTENLSLQIQILPRIPDNVHYIGYKVEGQEGKKVRRYPGLQSIAGMHQHNWLLPMDTTLWCCCVM